MTQLEIIVGGQTFVAELNESASAQAVLAALPLRASGNVWGEEIYFDIPVKLPEAPDAVEEVPIGTLAYWPPGNAFCIFYGPTPVSRGQQPRAYSPVNVIGRMLDDVAPLRHVRSSTPVQVRLAGQEG